MTSELWERRKQKEKAQNYHAVIWMVVRGSRRDFGQVFQILLHPTTTFPPTFKMYGLQFLPCQLACAHTGTHSMGEIIQSQCLEAVFQQNSRNSNASLMIVVVMASG